MPIVSVSVVNTSKTADRILRDVNSQPVHVGPTKSKSGILMDQDYATRLKGVGEGGAFLKVTSIGNARVRAATAPQKEVGELEHNEGDDGDAEDPANVAIARNLLEKAPDADLTELKAASAKLLEDRFPSRPVTRAKIIKALEDYIAAETASED